MSEINIKTILREVLLCVLFHNVLISQFSRKCWLLPFLKLLQKSSWHSQESWQKFVAWLGVMAKNLVCFGVTAKVDKKSHLTSITSCSVKCTKIPQITPEKNILRFLPQQATNFCCDPQVYHYQVWIHGRQVAVFATGSGKKAACNL